MKHNKQNIIKVLERIEKINRNLSKFYEAEGLKDWADRYNAEANATYMAISLLEDAKFFNNICKNLNMK